MKYFEIISMDYYKKDIYGKLHRQTDERGEYYLGFYITGFKECGKPYRPLLEIPLSEFTKERYENIVKKYTPNFENSMERPYEPAYYKFTIEIYKEGSRVKYPSIYDPNADYPVRKLIIWSHWNKKGELIIDL